MRTMKHKRIIAWIMTFAMVLSVFSSSAVVFATETVEAKTGFLSEVSFASSSSATAEKMELSPQFDAETKDYTVTTPDTTSAVNVWATLSEAGEGAKITAKWTRTTGKESTATVTSGKTTGQNLSMVQTAGGDGNSKVVLEVVKGEETQVYTFTTKVGSRSLSGLTVKAGDAKLKLGPTFDKTVTDYVINTTENVKSVTLVPAVAYDDYVVTVEGTALTDGKAVVDLGDQKSKTIVIKITKENSTIEGQYQVTVNRTLPVKATIKVSPEGAIVNLKDDQGQTVMADGAGVYNLTPGDTYSYTVTKYGYVGQSGELTLTEDTVKEITLAKAADNTAINKDLPAYWPSLRGNDTNMAITDAKTPASAMRTQLKWAEKYGEGWSNSPSVQLIVNDKVISIVSNKIYMINPDTGEVEKEGQLVGPTNWGYTPPTYADGMIFCPLSNGRVQAVNAETLESLWVYQDQLKGQSLSAITYKDGYIYTGFWNSETKDANYVCLSTTDEDPTQTEEGKLPTWTYTQAGGFYWAGSIAIGDAIIVGTDDGQNGNTSPSNLLSLDRKTGKVISKLELFGDQRSTIAYDKETGRLFGTTKAGYLFSVAVDQKTGELSDLKTKWYGREDDAATATMSTSTPIVYKGTAYFGYSASGNFGGKGYCMIAADANTLEEKYRVPLKGYPQGSGLLSTAYEETDGHIYMYWTYNEKPGGITLVKAKPDAKSADEVTVEEIYDAKGYEQYCITSLICDANGTIYYKNDSCNIFAVKNCNAYMDNIEVIGGEAAFSEEFKGNVLDYEVTVDPGTTSVDLKLTAEEAMVVTVNDETQTGDTKTIKLIEGKATVTVKVTNAGDERVYTLNIRERSKNAALSALKVNESNSYTGSAKALTPAFDAETKDYVAYGVSSSRSFVNLWPDAADSNAEVKVFAVAGIDPDDIHNTETGEIDATATTYDGHDRYAIYFNTDCKTAMVRVQVTAEAGDPVSNYYVTLTKQSDEAAVLEEIKTVGQQTMADYHADIKYSGDDARQYNEIIEAAQRRIARVESVEEINDIIVAAKAKINRLSSDAEKLEAAKEASLEKVDAYIADIDIDAYRDAEKTAITEAVETAKAVIKAAEDTEAMDAAITAMKKAVKAQKTEAQLSAEEEAAAKAEAEKAAKKLAEAKEVALTEIRAYNGIEALSKFRLMEKVEVLSLIIEATAAINDAQTMEELNTALADAKAKLDAVKTDDDYKKEAMAAAENTVTVEATSFAKVTLTWNAVDEAEKYQIYRADEEDGEYKRICTTKNTSFVNTKNVKCGKTYYYKVRAFATTEGGKVYSTFSQVKSAKPTLAKVTNVKVKAGTKKATVSWKKVKGATGYQIYRYNTAKKKYTLVKTIKSGSTVKWTNTNLKSGKTQKYKVRAYRTRTTDGQKVYGSFSSVVNAKVK